MTKFLVTYNNGDTVVIYATDKMSVIRGVYNSICNFVVNIE